jgi:hypothetical protein
MIDNVAAVAAVNNASIGLTVVSWYARQLQKVRHLLQRSIVGIAHSIFTVGLL